MSGAVQFWTRDPAPLPDGGTREAGYRFELWRPSLLHPFPPGRRDPRIMIYTLFHLANRFANRDYAMGLLRGPDGEIAHSSMVMPGFFRFPFMGPGDLQIGATETRPDQRGKGLAVRAIAEIMRAMGPQRRYWYLTEAANAASVSVIRKAGFHLAGTGAKVKGGGPASYRITDPAPAASPESILQ
jgi:RimJ/RimL family protein N-acetyltransferase